MSALSALAAQFEKPQYPLENQHGFDFSST
jgi:hypothetical protein